MKARRWILEWWPVILAVGAACGIVLQWAVDAQLMTHAEAATIRAQDRQDLNDTLSKMDARMGRIEGTVEKILLRECKE